MSKTKRVVFGFAGVLSLGVYFDSGSLSAALPGEHSEQRASDFPHGKAHHRKLECSKCHSVSAAKPDVESFPGHSACISCHNFAAQTMLCGVCHNGTPVSKSQPSLFKFPKQRDRSDFGIDFSHPAHLKPVSAAAVATHGALGLMEKSRCTSCHRGIEQAEPGARDMSIETGHPSCFKCHGEKPVKPPGMNQCAECHKLDGPHLPRLFGIVREFRHEDHEYDIRPKRKRDIQVARQADFLCAECHRSVAGAESLSAIRMPEEDDCVQCHNGRLGLPDALGRGVLDNLKRR